MPVDDVRAPSRPATVVSHRRPPPTMRKLLLLLVFAALLVTGWKAFRRSSQAAEGDDQAARASLVPLDQLVGEPGSEPGGDRSEPGGAREQGATPAAPRPRSEPRRASDGGGGALAWGGDPVVEGRLLVHEVQGVEAYVNGEGERLERGSRELLFGLACAITGRLEQARTFLDGEAGASGAGAAERELLRGAVEGRRLPAEPLDPVAIPPRELGGRMALLEQQAEGDLRAGRYAEAARGFSALLLAELDAPWVPERAALLAWAGRLKEAQSHHRWDRRGDWPSLDVEVRPGESLVAVRKRVVDERPGMALCTGLIERSNQLGRYIHPGDVLRIPTEPAHALVDLSERMAFFMMGDEVLAAWEVAVGREERTVPGRYRAGDKLEEPPWFRPGGGVVPYGDPENPLGTRWIGWEGSRGLGFHGTDEPNSIGRAASDGCIRMRNEDVEELFEILPVGAEIEVRS